MVFDNRAAEPKKRLATAGLNAGCGHEIPDEEVGLHDFVEKLWKEFRNSPKKSQDKSNLLNLQWNFSPKKNGNVSEKFFQPICVKSYGLTAAQM